MKKRIKALYKNSRTNGYLQVKLESKSFSAFFKNRCFKKIVDYEIDLLKQMKEKREGIDKKKAALEEDKDEPVALKNNLDDKKKQN